MAAMCSILASWSARSCFRARFRVKRLIALLPMGLCWHRWQLYDELDEVLRRPKFDRYVQEDERLRFLAIFIRDTSLVEVTDIVTECRDVKDNKFLELALSGSATCILSGDSDLLVLHPFRGIPIVTPQGFLSQP